MSTTKTHYCYHVNVPALMPDMGLAKFEFVCQVADAEGNQLPEETIPVMIPYPVLESLIGGLPRVLNDLKKAGGAEVFAPGSGAPN